jgi:hypothetical protein
MEGWIENKPTMSPLENIQPGANTQNKPTWSLLTYNKPIKGIPEETNHFNTYTIQLGDAPSKQTSPSNHATNPPL